MLDLKNILQNKEVTQQKFASRGLSPDLLYQISNLDEERKKLTHQVELKRSELNELSKKIGELKKQNLDTTNFQAQVQSTKSAIVELEYSQEQSISKLNTILEMIPNIIADDVPIGTSERDNVEVKKWGQITTFSFDPKDHVMLGENLQMLDMEAGAKITGARFSVLKGDLARLERALSNFMLDQHRDAGYLEVVPPFIAHEHSLYGTGNLPKFKDDLFKIDNFPWCLIPTAEVPLTNLKREQIMKASELPLKYCALTPCFRSEAGSYGKDTKGLIRVHQFYKVELVNITTQEASVDAHLQMRDRACSILEMLGLPYRVVVLCSGDMGFSSAKTFDLEVWLPGQNTYREISSVSNCSDFQARRAGIRYKREGEKPQFAHTLNGSGLAVGRTLVAIMENYQDEDGSIRIPHPLQKYMGGQDRISSKSH